MNLFLGIDGGQSSTTALIGDESGDVIGHGVAGPCNHVPAAEAREKLLHVLKACVGDACTQAGLPVDPQFNSCCAGFSGGPADKREVAARAIRSEKLMVTDDAFIALSGSLAGEPGAIVIAGTGSIAFGRNARGETARAGGWGYIYGDEGSAFDIVRQALRAALRQAEGWGSATRLSEMFSRETLELDMDAVLHAFYTPGWPRARVAQLAIYIERIARDGDPIAQQILRNAGHQLASLASGVGKQLWPDQEAVKIAYVGGVFASEALLQSFIEACEGYGYDVRIPLMDPAAGALLEAYRLAGMSPDVRKLLISKF